MFTLVKKTVTEIEFVESEIFKTLDDALAAFYHYPSSNVADASVEKFDITILNDNLIPCKTDHFVREV